MEATAVSVSKAVLEGALGCARSILAEEIALRLGVEKDVAFIADELEIMQSSVLMMPADEEQINKDKVLQTWVKQVREVAYNVEDGLILMDDSVHSDKKLMTFWWCLRRTLWERRDIATVVKELKAKVEDVSNRNLCYRLIKGSSSSMPTSTAQEQGSFDEERRAIIQLEKSKEEEQSKETDGNKASDKSAGKTTVTQFDDVLLGRETEKSKLIELVGDPADKSKLKVISVWGMGGIGKTTLVRNVYRQLGGAWNYRAWATAVRPFNLEQLVRRLGTELLGVSTKETTTMELQELKDKLSNLLQKENCLIVLDDISSPREWDLVKSYLENARRVVITTREKYIAKHFSGDDNNMCNLGGLTEDVALDLFKNKVFKDDAEKIKLSLDMNEQARLILKKCDGLPLAILTIGGFLATKPKTASEWRKMYHHISTDELEINQELRTINTVLLRSYDGLPYNLKLCFLYLSIFPEDHKIRRKRVIKRWVAEGYAREMHGMTAEEVGDKYFEELLGRSMVMSGEEVNIYSGKIESCQVHDIMRQICISKAREENLAFTLEDGCGFISTQGVVRHLAISSSGNTDKQDVSQRIVGLPHVRSLTVFGGWRSFFISKKMRLLRVMDLEDMQGLKDHHLNQIGVLIHLKYLSLRGCEDIRHLPNSVGSLRNLQTLDIRGTWIQKLPPNITNLGKLQFLRSDGVFLGGIWKLNALCTLASIKVYKRVKSTIPDFTLLYQLRKLGVEGITETNSKEFWSATDGLNHLRSLSVNWHTSPADKLDSFLDGSLFPPRSLENLKLGSRAVRLSKWIHQLQNLSKLQLYFTKLQHADIQAVGKLPNLSILGMRMLSFVGEQKLLFEQGSFPSLVRLDLNDIDRIPSIMFEDGTMPKLELLRIQGWIDLEELSGLKYLTKLKELRLDFHRSGSKKFQDNVNDQIAEHPNVNVVRK